MNGCVGSDRFSKFAQKLMRGTGVDTSPVFGVGTDTGLALITVADSGENQIIVLPGANAHLGPEDVDLGEHDGVLCQLEIPIETVAAAARAAEGIFCLNAPRLTALTLGEEGAVLLEDGEEVARARPPKVNAVDGTGAGDAFTAGLVVSLLEERDREDALRRACAAGALAASRAGAQPSLPTAAEVDEILRA